MMVSDPPALKQLMHVYETYSKMVVGVQAVKPTEVSKYGIIAVESKQDGIMKVNHLIEKPSPADAPSNLAIMGRYILEPSIFPILHNIELGASHEYQLTDALTKVCQMEGLLALELIGRRYDIGDKFEYIKAILEIGLKREELRPQLMEYLQQLLD
ncbi:UTP--glucose-1-phosphate uridylyltransferase [Paenibacillus sp. DS2015]